MLMRHFLQRAPTDPVASLTVSVIVTSDAARLVPTPRGSTRVTASRDRARRRAVPVAPVARAAQQEPARTPRAVTLDQALHDVGARELDFLLRVCETAHARSTLAPIAKSICRTTRSC